MKRNFWFLQTLVLCLVFAILAQRCVKCQDIEILIDSLKSVASEDFICDVITIEDKLEEEKNQQETCLKINEKLVRLGPEAIPQLLEALSDPRVTEIPPVHFGPITYSDRFDCNLRTRANRIGFVAPERRDFVGKSYQLKVGDLCFFLLGQIVNRDFRPYRKDVTGVLYIYSTVESQHLRDYAIEEWKQTSLARHSLSLIADLNHPDSESRFLGACNRLRFYYPDLFGDMIVQRLRAPVCNEELAGVFIKDACKLSTDAQLSCFRTFVEKNGSEYEGLIQSKLVDKLSDFESDRMTNDADDHNRDHGKEETELRLLLANLFSMPLNVESKQCEKIFPWTDYAKSLLIENLSISESSQITDTVRDLYYTNRDGRIGDSCFKYFTKRQDSEFVIKVLKSFDMTCRLPDRRLLDFLEVSGRMAHTEVRDYLFQSLSTVTSGDVLVAISNGLWENKLFQATIQESAERILLSTPYEDHQQQHLLAFMVKHNKQVTFQVIRKMIDSGEVKRIECVCLALSHERDLALKFLVDLLSDQRPGELQDLEYRVCDRAAQSIFSACNLMPFKLDWPIHLRDFYVARLRQTYEREAN